MKKILFLLCAVLVALTFFAGTSTAAKYKPGTYRGTAKGYDKPKHPGEIEVAVTITGGKISKIDLVKFNQTDKGKQGESAAQAKAEIPSAIMKKQSIAVDAVAKATISSNGIQIAVARALEQAR